MSVFDIEKSSQSKTPNYVMSEIVECECNVI